MNAYPSEFIPRALEIEGQNNIPPSAPEHGDGAITVYFATRVSSYLRVHLISGQSGEVSRMNLLHCSGAPTQSSDHCADVFSIMPREGCRRWSGVPRGLGEAGWFDDTDDRQLHSAERNRQSRHDVRSLRCLREILATPTAMAQSSSWSRCVKRRVRS